MGSVVYGGKPEKGGLDDHRYCKPFGKNQFKKLIESNSSVSMKDIHEYMNERRRNSFFTKEACVVMTKAWEKTGSNKEGEGFKREIIDSEEAHLIYTGGFMEMVNEELQTINEQVKDSKQILKGLYNEVRAIHDQVDPELKKQIMEIRTARMTTVTEIQQMLSSLRDLRKFFLEEQYEKEIQRMKEFIVLCNEIKKLKESGFLDIVSDTILNLSMKGENK